MSGPRHKRIFGVRIVISFIPVMLLLFAIAHIPLPQGFTPPDIMTSALSRLLILGTIILGVLSGFGAISNSWGFIPFLASSRYTLFMFGLRFLNNTFCMLGQHRQTSRYRLQSTHWLPYAIISERGAPPLLERLILLFVVQS